MTASEEDLERRKADLKKAAEATKSNDGNRPRKPEAIRIRPVKEQKEKGSAG